MNCVTNRFGAVAVPLALAAVFLSPSGCRVAGADANVMNIVVIHGTAVHMVRPGARSRTTRWWSPDSAFSQAVAGELGAPCRFIEFQWSGDNAHDARLAGGEQLARKLRRLAAEGLQGPVYLIGHSHGGNVALNAVNRMEAGAVAGVFLLGTPQMSVRSPAARACDPVEESGDPDVPGCGDSTSHWLYWGRAASRVTGAIWNLYSPEDPVQTTLAKWSSLWGAGALSVGREYAGVDRELVHNGVIHWRSSPGSSLMQRLIARSGVAAHNALHCERMGKLIGRLFGPDASFEEALEHAGLSPAANEITDMGRRLIMPEPRPGSSIPEYRAARFDVNAPPYRVNMGGDGVRPVGALLIHGFTAAPTEMRPFAEYLHAHEPEWAIRCVQLAGHGADMAELRRTTEVDWMKSARDGYAELNARCNRMFVVGLSLGAVLSCRLAAEDRDGKIAGLVLLAPVFDLPWPSKYLLGMYGLVCDSRPKPPHRAAYYQRHGLYSHMAYPVKGLQSVRRNGRAAWKVLPEISVPTMIVAGRLDRLLPQRQVRRIATRIGSGLARSSEVEVVDAPASGHVLTVEPDADDVHDACLAFLRGDASQD